MSSPAALVETLLSVSEPEYVRFVADWLTRPSDLNEEPALTGRHVIDALVAAAAAHAAMTAAESIPAWANDDSRVLEAFWYAGPNGFFPNALVHSPLPFVTRGVLIEEDSLVSI